MKFKDEGIVTKTNPLLRKLCLLKIVNPIDRNNFFSRLQLLKTPVPIIIKMNKIIIDYDKNN